MRRAAALAVALALAGCSLAPKQEERVAFAVMGDVPYSAAEEASFERMMRTLDGERLAFVVHVGDFRGGAEPCSDALFARRLAQFDASAHAFAFTPGDNEWADCPGAAGAGSLERLARLREVFFARDATLGRRTLAQESQRACLQPPVEGCGCGAMPENRAWSVGRVRFATVNVTGSHNNVGRGAASDADARCRDEGNARWLARAAAGARDAGDAALVILTQANPWWTGGHEFDRFLASVRAAADTFARPVLLVHGDTHYYRADFPFRDAFGEPVPNLARLETWGSPFVGWVRVEVDPARPQPFTFESRLESVQSPWWWVRALLRR